MTQHKNKVVLISGGMGGVGQAAARAFANDGYTIGILYHNTEKEVADAFARSLPTPCIALRCDIRDEISVSEAIDKVTYEFGDIDICIHGAVGAIARKNLTDLDLMSFKNQFEAGLFGGFNLFHCIAKGMKERKSGLIIGITSTAIEEEKTAARMGAYAVAKIALRGLLRELFRELLPSGVRVVAVAPNLMQTAINNDLPEKYFEFAKQLSPEKRLMTPEDVAQALIRISLDHSINGVSYTVGTKQIYPL